MQQPETLDHAAGNMVLALRDFLSQQLGLVRMHIAIVVRADDGPPSTIDVTIHGQPVPAVRYIGTEPVAGDLVVVLSDGPTYICLGVLT